MIKTVVAIEDFAASLDQLVAMCKQGADTQSLLPLISTQNAMGLWSLCDSIPGDWRNHKVDSERLQRALGRIVKAQHKLKRITRDHILVIHASQIETNLAFAPPGSVPRRCWWCPWK